MYIDEPIETTGLTDADIEKLMATVYERMTEHLRVNSE
jgi:hypothetical protein